MSSLATPGPWLFSYESDASDEDKALSPEDSVEVMVDEWGTVLVHSSFADDPDLFHEVFTNYDSPGRPSAYWTEQRQARLPEEARALCLASYPLSR
jgi:hypothetical protein